MVHSFIFCMKRSFILQRLPVESQYKPHNYLVQLLGSYDLYMHQFITSDVDLESACNHFLHNQCPYRFSNSKVCRSGNWKIQDLCMPNAWI